MAKEVKVKEAANMTTLMDEYAGEGISDAPEDNLVPLVMILQKQSPQVETQDPRYIEGAKPADIWLRNSPHPIVKGADGILFQPCYFSKDWLEWVPRERGGGFVARHNELPPDAKKFTDPQNPNRVKFLRPNGNEVLHVRNHIGYVIANGAALPYVIPMTSSGHTVSRQWMSDMRLRRTASGRPAATYAFLYRLKTRLRSNQFGSWFTWDIKQEGGELGDDDLRRGHELFSAFVAGTRQVETPEAEDDAM